MQIEWVSVTEPKVISQTRKKWEQYQDLNIKAMRKTQSHILVRRIIQRLLMASSINMTNGKEPVTKAWSSISIWERLRDQVLIWNKILFTCLLRIKHPNSQCQRVIEVFWHPNTEKHPALATTIAMFKLLNLDHKLLLLLCQKLQEMFHSQNMVPIILLWSAKDFSERW